MSAPMAPAAASVDTNYGRGLMTYRAASFWKRIDCQTLLILSGCGAFFAFVAASMGSWDLFRLLVALIAAMIAGVYVIHRTSRLRRIELFEYGLQIINQAETEFEVLWTDVEFIEEQREGTTDEAFCGITLHRGDGKKYRIFQDFVNFHPLKHAVLKAVYDTKRPLVMAALKRGETVDFGGLKLHRGGVVAGKEIVPWKRVQVSYESIYTVVRALPNETKIWQMATSLVPNFGLLLDVFAAAGVEA